MSSSFCHRLLTGGLISWLLAILTATSCDRAADMSIRVDTLGGGRVLVSNPDWVTAPDNPVTQLVEDLRIGRAVGEGRDDSLDVFGLIIALAVDDAGRIYVADHQASDIRVFDATGNPIGRIGHRGTGPGEFQFLAGITWQRENGILWAMDPVRHRLIAFDSTGTLLHESRHGDFSFATIPWNGKTVNRFLFEERPRDVLVRYRTLPTGGILTSDTLRLPLVEANTYTVESKGVTALSSVPMSPHRMWTVASDSNAWIAVTSYYEMHEVTFAGDTVRTVKLRRSASALEGRERDSVAAAAGIPARRLPGHKPVFRSLSPGPDRQLWVEVDAGGVARRWDVFDQSGYYLGRVESPVGLQPSPARLVIGAGTVTGVLEDEVGVQYVVRFRVTGQF